MGMYREYKNLQFRRHWSLSEEDWRCLGRIEGMVAAIIEVPILPAYRRSLLQVSLRKGARATTAIEGNTLSDADVERIERGQSLPPSKAYQGIEVQNVLAAMNTLLGEVARDAQDQVISPDLLKRFHVMIGKGLGTHLDAIPGRFRDDDRVVGPYRCPDHRDVPALIQRMCDWLRSEFRYAGGDQPFWEAIIEAIVAHVYLEWIHPFGDGNGRVGRLLEFYVLLRAGMPDLAGHILSNHYNDTRPEYYRQLQEAGKTHDLTAFIRYALQGLADGLEETLRTVQDNQITVAWEHYAKEVLDARRDMNRPVLHRRRILILALVRNEAYELHDLKMAAPPVAEAYAHVSGRTLDRDVQYLVEECGLLRRRSDGRVEVNLDPLRMTVAARRRRPTAPPASG